MQTINLRPKRNLKKLFLITAVIFIAGIIFWPDLEKWLNPPVKQIKVVSTIQPENRDVVAQEAIVNEARDLYFDGVDKNNQPYVLTAKQGTEFKEGIVELIEPNLTLNLASGQTVTLKSDKAIFHREQQQIELESNVVLSHTTGFEFTTSKAWIDMKTSDAFGTAPITGKGPQGDIYAKEGFKLINKGEKISFKGRPELLIRKGAQ